MNLRINRLKNLIEEANKILLDHNEKLRLEPNNFAYKLSRSSILKNLKELKEELNELLNVK